jgi:beta-glucosidase
VDYEQGCTNHRLTPLLDPFYLLPQPGSDETGLTGSYYANNDFQGEPVFRRLEKNFVFNHGRLANHTAPGEGLDPDLFSVLWRGIFKPPLTGQYRFGLMTDGFCRVLIDGRPVVQKWMDGSGEEGAVPGEERVGEIGMEAGQAYELYIAYCQNTEHQGFRRLRLGCEPPLEAEAVDRAVRLAAAADIALVSVGLTEEYDAEFQDREHMDLPGVQSELINRVARANPNTIVVLSSGSPVSVEEWVHRVPAVLQSGYIGQEGGHALSDVLFGKVNPSGKLTETYPKRLEDTPAFINYPGENGKVLYGEGIFVGYRYYDKKKIEPSFPFGHGLSYTRFEYARLVIDKPDLKQGEILGVSVDITNTGPRQGKETVQLYLRDIESSLVRPPKELKGFDKVDLGPGQTAAVRFELTPRDLSFYDPDQQGWICEPGEFEVLIGSSSADIRVRGIFTVRH